MRQVDLTRNTLTKQEKLCSHIRIGELFEKGSSFFVYPFRIKYLPNSEADCHSILFSVPKRRFKRSVDRHLLARRMREAYRLNKKELYYEGDECKDYLSIAIIYSGNDKLAFEVIEDKLISCLSRLKDLSKSKQ